MKIRILAHGLSLEIKEVSSPDEKLSLSHGNSIRYNNFNNFINVDNLVNLGFSSNCYTGHNKREDHPAIFARLDRTMANHHLI